MDNKNKRIDLYSAFTGNYRHLFNQSQVMNAMGYEVGTCVIQFTIKWRIPKYTHAIKQEGCSSLETVTIKLHFTTT